MRVLICDDDAATRFVLKRLLTQHLGWSTVESEDGVEALTRLEQGDIDLLLLDLQMPTMDGLEVLEAIRATPSLKRLAVVAVSNERREDVVRRLLTMGIGGYVLKPIRAEKLLAILDRLRPGLERESRNHGRAASRAGDIRLGPDVSAMLIDGSLDYRHFFLSHAQRFGPIVEASTGASALIAWQSAPTPLVFVGEDLGVLSTDRLIPKLRAMAAGTPLRLIRLMDVRRGASPDGCDDVIPRSYVSEELRGALKAFVHVPTPLDAIVPRVGEPQALVASAACHVFGVMLETEITALPPKGLPESCAGALATIHLHEGLVLTFSLFATEASLRVIAARMVAGAPEDVSPDDAVAAAGELVNLITGRLIAAFNERNDVCEVSLPTLVPSPGGWGVEDLAARGVLQHFAINSTTATLYMALDVR